jgi:hypothetical protein
MSARIVLGAAILTLAFGGFALDRVTEQPDAPTGGEPVGPLPIPGATDTFDRADSAVSLGSASTGQRWKAVTGTWGIADGAATVTTPGAFVSLATIAVGATDGRYQVTAEVMAPGFGLAFRCRSLENCWRVEAVPNLGTWNVIKTIGGSEITVGNLGTVPIDNGTTIAVTAESDRLTFFVNDEEVKTVLDGELSTVQRAGISLREPASAGIARWSGFAMAPRETPGTLQFDSTDVRDDFDRADADDLGSLTSGEQWKAVSGRWGIRAGRAALIKPSASGLDVALIDVGTADGTVQVTVMAPQDQTGVAFRCRDADNCLFLGVVPGFGTWNIYKIIDGQLFELGNVDLAPTLPGTTVSVEMQGTQLNFYVNGLRVRSITEPDLASETQVGLAVNHVDFATSARWSKFLFKPADR